MMSGDARQHAVTVTSGETQLEGALTLPRDAQAVVVFAHGSGSSRHSPRNLEVADHLNRAGLGTLLMDLLTEKEERRDLVSRALRFDIPFLASRVADAARWVASHQETAGLAIGCFGASTGAGAALVAAANLPDLVKAVVSRGGRPDLANDALPIVRAPTLLIVGDQDRQCIPLNERAFARLKAEKKLEIVPDAGHLFEEPGTLDQVADLAAGWFLEHLAPS